MKQILLLLRIRLRALSASLLQRGKNKANGIGAMLLLALLFGIVFLSFGVSFFSFFALMRAAADTAGSDPSLYLSLAAALTLGICLFGSTMTAQSQLYQAKDTEFLLSMPLRPGAIFASRLLLLVFLNVVYGSVVALPAFVVYCIYDFTPLGALSFLFFFVLLFFVALAISCLLGWLIALVSSRIKRKNLVTILFSLIFLVLYFAAFSSMETLMEKMEANILGFTAAASPFLVLFSPVAAGILGTDWRLPLLFAAVSLAAILLVATVLIRSYVSILTANRGGVAYVYREKKAKVASPLLAVIRKELARFLGCPGYMLNAGLGLVMLPIAGILLLVGRADLAASLATPELSVLLPLLPAVVAGAGAFLASTVLISAPSVSLEAKNLWVLQTMPIPARTVLLGKALFQVLVSAPFFLLFSILAAIALAVGPLDFLAILLLPQAASVFSAFFGVAVGFLIPKFDWTSETAAVKSSACVGITMLGMMLVGLACELLCALPHFIGLPVILGPCVAAALLLGASFGFYAYLRSTAAERRFARLQN